MIRPTHLVTLPNSVGSLRLFFGFASGRARLSVRRAQNALTLASLVHFSATRQSKITFSASSLDRRKPDSSHPAMDPTPRPPTPKARTFLSEIIVNIEEEPPPGDDDDSTSYEDESWEQTKAVLPEELSRSVVALTCDSVAKGGVCDVYLVGTAHVSQESCREVQAVISFLKPQVVFLELCSSRVALLSSQNIKQITMRRTWAKMPLWHKIKLLYCLFFQAVFLPSSEDLNRMLKEMDDVDMLTLVIQEMSKDFPTLMETLVHERDKLVSFTFIYAIKNSCLC
ncbi:hypothetical protein I3760_10G108400 [Carya illinoinensis]|nr:hypothetical protein I3760_10G108400 [Carya illinoinensis]